MTINDTLLALEVLYKIIAGFFFNWEALFIICLFGLGLFLFSKVDFHR